MATATACALLGLECVVYMGEEDIERQSLNVFRMKMLGSKVCASTCCLKFVPHKGYGESQVVPVTSGTKTLKDAINEAMRDWVSNVETTHYLIGSAVGPHPFPTVRTARSSSSSD